MTPSSARPGGICNHLLGQQRRTARRFLPRAAVLFARTRAGRAALRSTTICAWIRATTWARSSTSTKPTRNLRPLTGDSRTAFRMAGPGAIRWVPPTTIINSPMRRTCDPRAAAAGRSQARVSMGGRGVGAGSLRDHAQSRSDRKDRGLFAGLEVAGAGGVCELGHRVGSRSRHARRRPRRPAMTSARANH